MIQEYSQENKIQFFQFENSRNYKQELWSIGACKLDQETKASSY